MSKRAGRQAENENLFREGGADVDELDLRCECGGNACAERLAVSVSDYLRVRRWDGRFLLVPGHQDLELENVVERHKSWLVVQTHEPFRALQPDERRRLGRPWG
jgi:hypothetical protein